MQRTMSEEGLDKVTKPWEEFVAFPYDDKVPPRIINGKRSYVEYTGGVIIGTITQGYGHTAAAGLPAIVLGQHWTESYAEQVLLNDMGPCVRHVNSYLKVATTQHQADALYDLDFNCPSATPHVTAYVNQGDWPGAERLMLQYVNSRGERMLGLVHRRNAEITWANTPDAASATLPTAAESQSPEVFSPKGEREPAPKTPGQSKTIAASRSILGGGLLASVSAAHEAMQPLKDAKQDLMDFGALDVISTLSHSPLFWVGLLIAGLAAFIEYDRRQKLANDHV